LGGGAGVVRDDDELRLGLESIQHSDEVADVLIIEGRVHFVKQAEGTGLRQEDSEQQRQRDQRLLAAGKKMDALRAFPARRRVNLDVPLERAVRRLEPQIALAAAKEGHEDVAEIL